jgi:hypothetical protein
MLTSILLAVVAGPALAVDYARDVKPVLAARCTSCHGTIRRKAGLRLDTAAMIRRGGDSGPAIEPGQSEQSLLIERVTAADVSERMPPESDGVALSPAEVATLRAWIDQGAHAPPEPVPQDPRQHWAYQPPQRAAIPRVANPSWARNPVDAFLAAAHQARGLQPAPPVEKDLWLRRAFLDLIGLPPTREQLHAFRADQAPDAWERVVDRLLCDPRYGERWGRHWMDVWRYSDWYGLGPEVRFSHPHLWHWRDWIVASLNVDKGYDRMVLEMLAGDELAPDDPATVRATGFLARNWDIFNRNVWLASTVEHTARAFLGVTLQCARCHDHKFDPIPQADYYRFRAFFEPYHLRIDRVPGESDRAKAGLPRAFDDFLDRPTYLFVRGDESQPEKSRPLRPATPAVLGGAVPIAPIPLPRVASCPDKRPFVIDEARAEAERAVLRAKAAVDSGKEPALTRAALAVAEAKRAALRAVLAAEQLEDEGAKASGSASWAEAARAAAAAQRALALAEARSALLVAERDTASAVATEKELVAADSGRKDAAAQDRRAKAAAALIAARGRLDAVAKQLAQAQAAAQQPPTTAYTPRPMEFPRAKTTYRDTPSNAPYAKISTGRRLALARWIVDRRNPLAARVAVNHVWARHFGEPLVGAMSDFGLRTPRPELVDLLDWLAVEFMESGWSLKHLHRLIAGSRAYRMRSSSARADEPNVRLDPDNRYAWRMNPRRMEGEVIRDTLLALAGRLDATLGGPDLPIAAAEAGTRRTLYYRAARDERIPLLTMFDAPNVEDCYRRHETIVPQQALAMTNSAMVLTRAAEIAAGIDREVGRDPAMRSQFVVSAFERILGRSPRAAELCECEAGLSQLAGAFAAEATRPGLTPEARARSALVHVLLNHNDFVTIR